MNYLYFYPTFIDKKLACTLRCFVTIDFSRRVKGCTYERLNEIEPNFSAIETLLSEQGTTTSVKEDGSSLEFARLSDRGRTAVGLKPDGTRRLSTRRPRLPGLNGAIPRLVGYTVTSPHWLSRARRTTWPIEHLSLPSSLSPSPSLPFIFLFSSSLAIFFSSLSSSSLSLSLPLSLFFSLSVENCLEEGCFASDGMREILPRICLTSGPTPKHRPLKACLESSYFP